MISPSFALLSLLLYMAVLCALAWWAERAVARRSSHFPEHPVIYSLGLTVFYTSWTFFGSVGRAATQGMSFLMMYVGAVLPMVFWWNIMRRLVRLKNSFRLTSIADLISARHNRSALLAGYVTLLLLIGMVPYLALQLKSIEGTFQLVTTAHAGAFGTFTHRHIGALTAAIMIVFTNAVGVRRLNPSERHPGMLAAVAMEGVFKLVAFLAVGCFVVYGLFNGIGDIFAQARSLPHAAELGAPPAGISSVSLWFSYLIISACAVMFLPRQFHMTVIENSHEGQIRTAMWLLPLYGLLITALCFPVALGGLIRGLPLSTADTFVLELPLTEGATWLALLAFLGGYAAATGMIMICAMTMATMLTNHVLIPATDTFRFLQPLRRLVLQCRWIAVALTIGTGYVFQQAVGGSYMLVSLGVMSFVAVAQIAPVLLGGLYWRRGNAAGAFCGLTAGFALWTYTLVLPTLARSGLVSMRIVELGPWGISLLRPEALLGLDHLAPIANTVLWSLAANCTGYVIASLMFPSAAEERAHADEFVDILKPQIRRAANGEEEQSIPVAQKVAAIERTMRRYLPRAQVQHELDELLRQLQLDQRDHISIMELAELTNHAERILSGSIGVASAHGAFKRTVIMDAADEVNLSEAYATVLARLRITPEELERRVDYYEEREKLLTEHAADLEQKVHERDDEIVRRIEAEDELRRAEEKYRSIFENAVEGMFQSTPSGRFVAVNRSICSILGYDSPEQLIASISDISSQLYVDPERRNELMQKILEEGTVSDFETQIRHRDGSPRWCTLHVRPVYDDAGNLRFIEGTIQDVTARRAAENEVRRLNEELEARVADRTVELASINRELEAFAYSISHDLRTPLRAIDGFSQVLLEDYGEALDDHGRRYLGRVREASQRMGRLIEHVLKISRLTRLEVSRETVDLSTLARNVAQDLELVAGNRHVVWKLADDLIVNTDPLLARVVLENLFGNALKFTRERSPAVIELGWHPEDGPSALFVRDNGVGFDMNHADKLFGIFQRLHRADEFEGDGIGLATVDRVVQRLGGRIRAEAEPGRGASFIFTLG